MTTSHIERNETRKSHESTVTHTQHQGEDELCSWNQGGLLSVLHQSQSCVSLHRKSGDEDVWPASERANSICMCISFVLEWMDGRALRSIGSWGPRLNDVSVRIQVFCSLSPHLKIHLNVFCFTRRRLFRNHSLSNADVMLAVSFVWHQTPLPESLLVARQRRDSGALFSQIE